MRLIFPDEGLVEQLKRIVNDGVTYHLFTNDVTPDRDTELAGLTEAAWSGYAAASLDETDFPTESVAGHNGSILGPAVAFLNSSGSPVDAYGYYVTDVANSMLLAAARFDDAPISKADAESFLVVPTWGDFSRFNA